MRTTAPRPALSSAPRSAPVTSVRAALRPSVRAALSIGAALLLGACDPGVIPVDPPPDGREIDTPDAPPPDGRPIETCPVSGTLTNPSLVVNDPAILARFGFARVVDQIRTTASIGGQTSRSLFQAWMRTFDASPASGDCDDPSVDPDHYGLACPRVEAKLASADPFLPGSGVEFLPLGLFDRFDLAPADGSNCGEYRIVYAMQSRVPTIAGRALIIFEGILPNPRPEDGIGACLPVARFWQALSVDPSPTSRAAKLEAFYFTGTAVPGFPPVVAAQSYGLALGATAAHGAGQIRTNFFIDSLEWQLREFKLRRTCTDSGTPSTCRLTFEHVRVKVNPAEELFSGQHARSASFRSQFLAQVPRLTVTSAAMLSLAPAEQFDEFESVSSTNQVVYNNFAIPPMTTDVDARLRALGSSLSTFDVLNRATTQTCAGCHQQSNNVPLGGGMVWPPSLEFTHIDENHRLSPALTQVFLPHRRAVLEAFINARCSATPTARAADALDLGDDALRAAAAEGLTIGGSAVGSPN
ncbi:MAG: hypothetical protein IPL61_38010 [Myxococcales bacterium]|nr:hypothetical protein [Myxococcales bacterium]